MSTPNPKWTFNTFIVFRANKIAYTSLQALLKNKGLFNPFFISGSQGTGKSHLLSAVGNELKKIGEKFLFLTPHEFFAFLKKGEYPEHIWLLVDDFNKFCNRGKEAQETLLAAFDSLLSLNIQMVFTSLLSHNENNTMDELKIRIQAGITVEIGLPDKEEIISLFKNKAQIKGLNLEGKNLELLKRIDLKDMREMEGYLNRLLVKSITTGGELNEEDIKSIMGKDLLFPDLIDEMEYSISQVIKSKEEEENLKKAFEEKVYVWEMKGFKTDRLKKFFKSEDTGTILKEYRKFIEDIEKLIEFQKEYGEWGERDPSIEEWFFDPDKVDVLREWIQKNIKEKGIEKKVPKEKILKEEVSKEAVEEKTIQEEVIPDTALAGLIKGSFNTPVIEVLENLDKIDEKLVVVYSSGHNGVTTHLEWAFRILREKKKIFLSSQELAEKLLEEPDITSYSDYKYIFIDDVPLLFEIDELVENTNNLLKKWLKEGKTITLGANKEPDAFIRIPCKKLKIIFPESEVLNKIFENFILGRNKTFTKDAKELFLAHRFADLKEFTDTLTTLLSLPKDIIDREDIPWAQRKPPEKVPVSDIDIPVYDITDSIWEEL